MGKVSNLTEQGRERLERRAFWGLGKGPGFSRSVGEVTCLAHRLPLLNRKCQLA